MPPPSYALAGWERSGTLSCRRRRPAAAAPFFYACWLAKCTVVRWRCWLCVLFAPCPASRPAGCSLSASGASSHLSSTRIPAGVWPEHWAGHLPHVLGRPDRRQLHDRARRRKPRRPPQPPLPPAAPPPLRALTPLAVPLLAVARTGALVLRRAFLSAEQGPSVVPLHLTWALPARMAGAARTRAGQSTAARG